MTKATQTGRIAHIEGLRALAALLVAFYHVFLDRISGGVDVFFVVSGLLITLALVRRTGPERVDLGGFAAGLALRLLPSAALVLVAVAVGTFFLLPAPRHVETLWEVAASALYIENWMLALKATDYLDRENPASPVQHFWAISMQGQFYVVAAALVAAGAWLARKRPVGRLAVVAWFYGVILLASFAYSLYMTLVFDQTWAYFDSAARLWEFLLGGLFGLLLVRQPSFALHPAVGWAGLGAFLLVGVLFPVGEVFPGVAALVPTMAAVAIIAGGSSTSWWSVGRMLGSGIARFLGSISYGVYLIHWPILVFYRAQVDVERVPWVDGALIIVASIVLATVLRMLVEDPFLGAKRAGALQPRFLRRAVGMQALALSAALAAGVGMQLSHWRSNAPGGGHGAGQLDGSEDWEVEEALEFFPALELAKQILPRSYADGCHTNPRQATPNWCVYGVEHDYLATVALVGGSHSAHWLPAVERVAERNGWRILYSTWSGCRLTADKVSERCDLLNSRMGEMLVEESPQLVITTANSGNTAGPPAGFVKVWEMLDAVGIKVLAFRGTPRMGQDIPECLARASSAIECSESRSSRLDPAADFSAVPGNVHVADFSNYFCNSEFCPAVIGGTLVYRDHHHLTVDYVLTLSDVLESELRRQLH